jgi:hypothetical protein
VRIDGLGKGSGPWQSWRIPDMSLAQPYRGQDSAPRGRIVGLRERKKAKTRAAIQEHALRLFRIQGYEATTIEQIADAAEVSPSTVFR